MTKANRSKYELAADVTLVIHILITLVISFGWIVAIFLPAYRVPNLVIVFGSVLIQLVAGYQLGRIVHCPFTSIENNLRRLDDPTAVYEGSCIRHYLKEFFGWEMSRQTRYGGIVFVVLVSLFLVLL